MSSEQLKTDLVSLIEDAREQLAYLHELGVTNVETRPQAAVSTQQATESKKLPSDVIPGSYNSDRKPLSASATVPGFANEARSSQPATVTSVPQDSLFGDVAAAPPVLEKSNETFEQIWADIGNCTRCPLHEGRTNIVHTEGNRRARLMFVGEAPGADEDAQSRPFVGRAGQLLTKIIEGNVNRCRPPGNRPPTSEEATMCKPFLLREIAVVQPEVIVVLGNTAMRNLLDIKQGITRVRGQFQDYQGVKVMPTFHPAYLLRDPSKKQETWQDLKKVRDYLERTPRRDS
jgi:DNA polymerase